MLPTADGTIKAETTSYEFRSGNHGRYTDDTHRDDEENHLREMVRHRSCGTKRQENDWNGSPNRQYDRSCLDETWGAIGLLGRMPYRLLDEFFKLLLIANRDEPVFDQDKTDFTPFSQLSIHRLPANTYQRSELPLRHFEIDPDAVFDFLAVFLRESQQRFTEPGRLEQKHRIFQLLTCLTESLAQNLNQFHARLWMPAEKWYEISAVEDEKFARHHRNRVRRSI